MALHPGVAIACSNFARRPARHAAIATALLLLLVVSTGCQTPSLMATPNLYLAENSSPFDSVPAELRDPAVHVLYATDRQPLEDPADPPFYGYERSTSFAYGIGEIQFGEDVTWDELVAASTTDKRETKLHSSLVSVTELRRAPDSNGRHLIENETMVVDPAILAQEQAVSESICGTLHAMLEHSDRKEVFLFVHGYNVQFDIALITIAEIWHFLGRIGVPVAYSWPAGRGGLRGYTTDRESGEFTIYHLKQFIRAIAACDAVEKVHVIAHSRGTDVALTAVRELYLEQKAGHLDPNRPSKFGNLILAAADLDLQVVGQRVVAEGLLTLSERLTIYISNEDRAISLASWLFDSVRRLGKLRSSDLTAEQKANVVRTHRLHLIDARVGPTDLFGHSYFYQDPAVSSDLILVLRDNRDPGAENGRPLLSEDAGFWQVYEDYPAAPRPLQSDR